MDILSRIMCRKPTQTRREDADSTHRGADWGPSGSEATVLISSLRSRLEDQAPALMAHNQYNYSELTSRWSSSSDTSVPLWLRIQFHTKSTCGFVTGKACSCRPCLSWDAQLRSMQHNIGGLSYTGTSFSPSDGTCVCVCKEWFMCGTEASNAWGKPHGAATSSMRFAWGAQHEDGGRWSNKWEEEVKER